MHQHPSSPLPQPAYTSISQHSHPNCNRKLINHDLFMLFDTENIKSPIFFMSSIQTHPFPVSTTIRNVQECTKVENRKIKSKIKSYLHALFLKETKKKKKKKSLRMKKKFFFLFGLTSFLALLSSPGRAIALPPASALVLASIFTLKLFKTSYFPNCVMDLVHS